MNNPNQVIELNEVQWLASEGGKFCRVTAWDDHGASPGKRPFEDNWQNKPLNFDDVQSHLKSGGNVGMICGKYSNGLILIDVDEDFTQFCAVFLSYKLDQAPRIVREGKNAGKIVVRITDRPDLAGRKFYKVGCKSPILEILATGNQGIIPPSIHPDTGTRYFTENINAPIPEITFSKLSDICAEWTGQGLEEGENTPTAKDWQRVQHYNNGGGSEYKIKILNYWTSLKVFQHFGMASNTRTEQRGKMVRLLGNGGLLINQDDGGWVIAGNKVGGDAINAWQWCKTNRSTHKAHGTEFVEILHEMARAAGIPEDLSYKPSQEDTIVIPDKKDVVDMFLQAPVDHGGHSDCLLYVQPQTFAFNETHGWLYYNGRFWQRDNANSFVKNCIEAVLIKRRSLFGKYEKFDLMKSCKDMSGNVGGTMDLLSNRVVVPIDKFDKDPDVLNCRNGAINLRTGEFFDHDPENYFTYCINADYNPNADRSAWIEFLKSALGKAENEEFVQLAVGYSLTGVTWEEILLYLFGPTRSGKGTFTETIIALLGLPLAYEADFTTFTNERSGDTQNFDLAPLRPCRFVAAGESNKNQPLNPAKIKQLTGRNWISCAFKHKTQFGYQPKFKIWLSSNHPVNVDVDDDAAWARIRVIEFPHSHLGTEDKMLKERLSTPEALEGLLAWAVEGARKYYQNRAAGIGLPYPEVIRKATEEQRDSSDFVKAFMNECLVKSTEGHLTNATTYQRYKTWCEDNGVMPKQLKQFSEAMSRKGYPTKPMRFEGKLVRVFEGLQLQPTPM